jgi:hypothetical protein
MAWVTYTRVQRVWERKRRVYVEGFGEKAQFREETMGWYAHLGGSYESIHLGDEKPELEPGDVMKITLEKVDGAGD